MKPLLIVCMIIILYIGGLTPSLLRITAMILTDDLDPSVGYLLNSTIIDYADCIVYKGLTSEPDCSNDSYHIQDKIVDNLLRFNYLAKTPNLKLTTAYLYRSVGDILYLTGYHKSIFIYFPDLFQPLYFERDIGNWVYPLCAAKLVHEYLLHGK